MGRQAKPSKRLDPDKRICKYCNLEECENEIHFINACPLYDDMRKDLFENILIKFPFVMDMPKEVLYFWLMSNLDSYVILNLAKYLLSSFKLRDQAHTVD